MTIPEPPVTGYLRDVHSRPLTAGRRTLEISDGWNTFNETPNGGYLLVTMLRGMRAELAVPTGLDVPVGPGGLDGAAGEAAAGTPRVAPASGREAGAAGGREAGAAGGREAGAADGPESATADGPGAEAGGDPEIAAGGPESEAVGHPDPLVVSATFLKPARPGPAELDVDVLRRGRTVTTARATLTQGGAPVVHAVASFHDAARRVGRAGMRIQAPDLPPVAECVDPVPPGLGERASIVHRVAYRSPQPPGWAVGAPSGVPDGEFWLRLNDAPPLERIDAAVLVDAAPPVVFEIGEFASATIELTVHFHARPTGDWQACRVSTRTLRDGLHEEDFEVWNADGELVAQSRQLAVLS